MKWSKALLGVQKDDPVSLDNKTTYRHVRYRKAHKITKEGLWLTNIELQNRQVAVSQGPTDAHNTVYLL